MEGGGISVSIPPTASPPHDPDLSPVGSPEITDSHLVEVAQTSEELKPSQTTTLTNDLRDKIIKQVEYYFSDANLKTDNFLMKHLTKNEEGFVPVAVIASFRKMKKLTQHRSLVVAALKESSLLVLSANEKKVKRLHPLPFAEVWDPELCTVLVENLPDDHTTENIQRIFGKAGSIKNVRIHEENGTREPGRCRIEEKLLSGKLHAVVEYETVEAAEKAVATLKNEQDWRYGMRVKLLKQRANSSQRKKGHESEKKSNVHASDPPGDKENHLSSEHHDDTPSEENGEHLAKEKNGNRGQNRRQPRRQKYRGSNGLGHGTLPIGHGSEISKPPPGPRMPDGTRGFTMGRGRPLPSNQN